MDDAEVAIVVLSSQAGTTRSVVRELRAKGIKAGVVKPRLFRPFPAEQLVDAIKGCKAVAVMDRAISFGAMAGCGPLFLDITSALYNLGVQLPVVNYIYGLGGRDTMPSQIESAFADLQDIAGTGVRGELVRYLGLRG
jgi:pyruvate ferredoxin oxidoreductase alpha subunit